jgi:hypothetical protein
MGVKKDEKEQRKSVHACREMERMKTNIAPPLSAFERLRERNGKTANSKSPPELEYHDEDEDNDDRYDVEDHENDEDCEDYECRDGTTNVSAASSDNNFDESYEGGVPCAAPSDVDDEDEDEDDRDGDEDHEDDEDYEDYADKMTKTKTTTTATMTKTTKTTKTVKTTKAVTARRTLARRLPRTTRLMNHLREECPARLPQTRMTKTKTKTSFATVTTRQSTIPSMTPTSTAMTRWRRSLAQMISS